MLPWNRPTCHTNGWLMREKAGNPIGPPLIQHLIPNATTLGPKFQHRVTPRSVKAQGQSGSYITASSLEMLSSRYSLTVYSLRMSARSIPSGSSSSRQQSSRSLAGGLGLPSSSTGIGIIIIGIIALMLQFGVFSSVTYRLGVLRTFRVAGLVFPVVYLFAPLLTILPMRSPPPLPADGVWLWICMIGLLFLQVTGRTFALPLMQVLTNNCSPHPSVLGSLHGVASSVSSGANSIGPVISS